MGPLSFDPSREEEPTPREEKPTPREEEPTPREEEPTPREEKPTPREEEPTPSREEKPTVSKNVRKEKRWIPQKYGCAELDPASKKDLEQYLRSLGFAVEGNRVTGTIDEEIVIWTIQPSVHMTIVPPTKFSDTDTGFMKHIDTIVTLQITAVGVTKDFICFEVSLEKDKEGRFIVRCDDEQVICNVVVPHITFAMNKTSETKLAAKDSPTALKGKVSIEHLTLMAKLEVH
jgi:hypothetical protein